MVVLLCENPAIDEPHVKVIGKSEYFILKDPEIVQFPSLKWYPRARFMFIYY